MVLILLDMHIHIVHSAYQRCSVMTSLPVAAANNICSPVTNEMNPESSLDSKFFWPKICNHFAQNLQTSVFNRFFSLLSSFQVHAGEEVPQLAGLFQQPPSLQQNLLLPVRHGGRHGPLHEDAGQNVEKGKGREEGVPRTRAQVAWNTQLGYRWLSGEPSCAMNKVW